MEPVLLYIDAASGSLIVQVLIASALAIPFFMRSQISRAIQAVRGRSRDSDPEKTSPPPTA